MVIKKSGQRSKGRTLSRLSISGINEQAKVEFIEFSKASALPYHETFQRMWDYFKYFDISLAQEEQELAKRAVEIAGKSFEKIKKTAIMRVIKRIIDNKDKVTSTAEIDRNSRTSPRAADLRIAEIVEEMMSHNDKEKKWYNRKFVSQKAIDDYAKERKKTSNSYFCPNMAVIKRYIENNRALLDEHHLKYKMDEEHNRKAYNYRRRQDTTQHDYKQEQDQENKVKKEESDATKKELDTAKKEELGTVKKESRYKKTNVELDYKKGQHKGQNSIKAKEVGTKQAKKTNGKRVKGDIKKGRDT